MRLPLRIGYGTLTHLARVASRVAPRGESKILRALSGRRGIRQRYRAWGAEGRDADRPLLWTHAPSVGEGLQAKPVLELMRAHRPDAQLVYTHFSPSAASFAASLPVDYHDYLVFDTTGDASVALDAFRPDALVFSKVDVWPNLVRTASARGVKLGIISATLSAASGRRSTIGRALLSDAYARMDAVGAIDPVDAERLLSLGVRPDVIQVTGDTRYDQVWQRAQALDRSRGAVAALVDSRPTMVAGSTWPSDEAVLLTAFTDARKSVADLRLIIAPHEPTEAHLAAIETSAAQSDLRTARLAAIMEDPRAAAEADVILVDRLGVLGDLYSLATIAFVGGGFHSAGLHSVLEPASFGVPVIIGPRHANSRDAALLISRGGASSVATPRALMNVAVTWLRDAAARAEAGGAARALVRSGVGAASRSFALVNGLLRH